MIFILNIIFNKVAESFVRKNGLGDSLQTKLIEKYNSTENWVKVILL